MSYWIGLDCGGTSIKAGLYDARGKEICIARHNLDVVSLKPGWAERDLDALWSIASGVLRSLVDQSPVAATAVAGIGISAQGKGLCVLDRDGLPLGHAMLSSDQRALAQVRQWQHEGMPARLHAQTLQTLWTGHPVSLLRWLKDEDPVRYASIGSILMSHDYLRYRLTGELGCEITNISESNLFDMHAAAYDPALAALLGIEEVVDKLPRIVGSTEIAGRVTPQAAALTGLRAGTPVVGGLFDVVATSLCAGIRDETRLNAVMGTWSVTTGVTTRVAKGQEYPFVYGRHAEAGNYIVHEASPTSAANLEWVAAQFGGLDYRRMNAAVAALPKAGSEVLFVPFLYGSNAGLGMKAGFYGMQSLHGQAHLIQAVFEGVVFSHMTHLSRMLKLFTHVQALRVTGGPARSPVWMQMLADVSGLRVETPDVEETGCLGAALCAAVGTGAYASCWEAMRAIDMPVTAIDPDAAARSAYQRKHQRYEGLVAALQQYEKSFAAAS